MPASTTRPARYGRATAYAGAALYEYCLSHGIPHRKCGKLIVATKRPEITKMESLLAQALTNGVEGMQLLEAAEAQKLEPSLFCVAALLSSETGIVDSHRLMLSLQGEIEDRSGAIALVTPVTRLAPASADGSWDVHYGGVEPGTLTVDAVVNAAGLGAQVLARATDGYPPSRVPRQVLAKGNYYQYAGRPVFSRLIYPAPVEGGLGTHVTLDLAGRMRFGPDVEWIDAINYDVDPRRADAFYASIRTYFPGLRDGALMPDYCGIRPKLTGPGEPAADFMIDGPAEHSLPGLVHLFGIESPGLTAALSIADDVMQRLTQ